MRLSTIFAGVIAVMALNVQAQVPKHIGQYESSTTDTEAIMQVTRDFRSALASKDAKKLEGLLLNSRILFTSPMSPERVRKARAEGSIRADGVSATGASDFLQFVAGSQVPIEERFFNIKITQDRHVAWVMFDFEFVENGKVENHGIEVWQMLKDADDRWKIMSVVWSSHGAPK